VLGVSAGGCETPAGAVAWAGRGDAVSSCLRFLGARPIRCVYAVSASRGFLSASWNGGLSTHTADCVATAAVEPVVVGAVSTVSVDAACVSTLGASATVVGPWVAAPVAEGTVAVRVGPPVGDATASRCE
jgi:hypothetical protein